jgi:hypothetical protein
MRVQKLGFVGLAVATLMSSMTAAALAQDEPATGGEATPAAAVPAVAPAPVAPSIPDSKMRLGLNVVPMPIGKFKVSGGGISESDDTAFAFGIMPFFDYLLSPNFFIGLGPMYTLNVKGKNSSGTAAKELDLQLRLGGEAPVSDKIDLYGYLSPGYSIIMFPSGAGSNPKGFELGIHAGGIFNVSPVVFLNAEVGYQLGFQKVSELGVSADAKSSFLQIGLGGGVRL